MVNGTLLSGQHGSEPPSAWVQRWSHLVPEQGVVLDVACGHGRHARWFATRRHPVVVVDRSEVAIDAVRAALAHQRCEAVVADIENGPWPFAGRTFDAVVVTHYLWRPLLPALLASLAPGAVFIYETFSAGNETVGKPARPDFLLRPGELLRLCQSLRVVAFEDGFEDAAHGPADRLPRFMQRIVAMREVGTRQSAAHPARYRLA